MLRLMAFLLLILIGRTQALAENPKPVGAAAIDKSQAKAKELNNPKKKLKKVERLDLNQVNLDQVEEEWESNPSKSMLENNQSVKIKEIVEPTNDYSYASFGRPDPFIEPDFGASKGANPSANLMQAISPASTEIQMVSILQGYPLSDLTVKGLWQVASGETRAIVLTPRNEGVVVKEGDPIASGKVLSIKRDQLQVRLYRLRSDGVREYEDVSLKIGSTNHQVKGVIKMEPGKEPVFVNPESEKAKPAPLSQALEAPNAPVAAAGALNAVNAKPAPVVEPVKNNKEIQPVIEEVLAPQP